ncbi:MAG: hypothetical protein AW10_02304 [Candidatus Accumulibacter appositus]|jgi:hypothetical protein|uniref:Uncharacterized protein n=1 Tax=Candidatus Accumulibacter appositus TaxID=1454003 RepID=A0A011NVT3_9PROT|nr:hypothetical protein [Accumulibacter sp.]EXI79451.1 MAG: hypothetical protein AW10_02304 [Candidatus Accumulibacter appositus]HRF04815.1 hypothetical protein [Accumulibacter sp.]
MGIDAVVVNASPLITLFRSAQADLVPSLFASVAEGIKKLRHAGLWLSDDLVRMLKSQSGE